MTTYLRTVLLLGFTALAASLSGCILETTSGNSGNSGGSCSDNRYFQVYWSLTDANGRQLTCLEGQAATTHVELTTNAGVYVAGKECRATQYGGFVFDFAGSTFDGIPTGTYVTEADLLDNVSNAVVNFAQVPPGQEVPMPSCAAVTLAYPFDLR